MGKSPTPEVVPQKEKENVFEAQFPLTKSGSRVEKVKFQDFGDQIRVVFDAETGEVLGTIKV